MTEWGDSANGARVRARRGGGSDVKLRPPPAAARARIHPCGGGGWRVCTREGRPQTKIAKQDGGRFSTKVGCYP